MQNPIEVAGSYHVLAIFEFHPRGFQGPAYCVVNAWHSLFQVPKNPEVFGSSINPLIDSERSIRTFASVLLMKTVHVSSTGKSYS